MKVRTVSENVKKTGDLLNVIKSYEAQWNKSTNTNLLLDCLNQPINGSNGAALLAANQDLSDKTAHAALTKALELVTKLAANENTDVTRLIDLLATQGHNDSTQMTIASFIGKNAKKHPEFVATYLDIIQTIAFRDDVTPEHLRKLLGHHYQSDNTLSMEQDSSFMFDLVEMLKYDISHRHHLENYLTILLVLAAQGKINADTIHDVLRKPFGHEDSIGTEIARITEGKPDCYILFAKLTRHLRYAGFHINGLLAKKYSNFRDGMVKESLIRYLKELPTDEARISETVNELMQSADEDDAIYQVLQARRGIYDTELDSGTLKELTAITGKATITQQRILKSAQKEAKNTSQQAALNASSQPIAVHPSAPPMEDTSKEQDELFHKVPPSEYFIPAPQFNQLDKDALGAQLRLAAGYKRNDELTALLKSGVDIDYCRDVGDVCADATALYLAAEQDNIEGALFLLQKGANVNYTRRNGATPLYTAIHNGKPAMVKLLLEHGARIDILTRTKDSGICQAASKQDPACMELIAEHLRKQFENNPQELVKFLKRYGHLHSCLKNAGSGDTLLALYKVTDFLLEKSISIETLRAMAPSDFTYKVRDIKEQFANAISKIEDANKRKLECEKVLLIDSQAGKQSLQHDFIMLSRDVTQCREGHGTHGVIQTIHESTINLNRDLRNAIVNFPNDRDLAKIRELLEKGADVNHVHKTISEPSLLFLAAQLDSMELINLLFAYGADPTCPNVTSKDNYLRQIAKDNKLDKGFGSRVLKYLETIQGEQVSMLPETIAELRGNTEIAEYLRQKREVAITNQQHAAANIPVAVFVPPAAPVQYEQPVPVFVPPMAVAEMPPPSYVSLYPDVATVQASTEAAMGNAYSVTTPVEVVYAKGLQEYLDHAAKAREQSEAALAEPVKEQVIEVVQVPVAPSAPVEDQQTDEDEKLTALLISLDRLKVVAPEKNQPVAPSSTALIMEDLLSISDAAPAKPVPTALDELLATQSSTTVAMRDLISFGDEAPAEVIAVQQPKDTYRNPFDELIAEEAAATPAVVNPAFNPFAIPEDVTEKDLKQMQEVDMQGVDMDQEAINKIFGAPAAQKSVNPFDEEEIRKAQEEEAQKVFEMMPSIPQKNAPAAIFFPPQEKRQPAAQKAQGKQLATPMGASE